MKRIISLLVVIFIIMTTSCNQKAKKSGSSVNPFFADFDTPFNVPAFDKIKMDDYLPAFQEGIKQQEAEIKSIIDNSATPTFDNTILPFDKSGKILTRVSNVFFNIKEAASNDAFEKLADTIIPMIANHNNNIMLNDKLFAKIKTVFEKRKTAKLDEQQIRVVEKYYKDFERQGANLPLNKKDALRKINEQLSVLGLKFGNNLLAETGKNFKLIVDKQEDVEGLPQANIDAAAKLAEKEGYKGKWAFSLSKPSWIPFLQYAKNRELREKLYKGYYMRGDNDNANDNKNIVKEIISLRAQKAQLLGYSNFAAYVLERNMAKTPHTVDVFLNKLVVPAIALAKKELAEMQTIADQEGAKFKIQPWDWWYYAEKLRKQKYDLDDNELKPYFAYDNVRDGMFTVANKLYGVKFEKNAKLPTYHKDAETFEVKEADGKHIGVLYIDPYAREGKAVGAWCTHFRGAGWENEKKIDPVISMVCNFSSPSDNAPALLTWDETTTLFHEFGHALHFLFTDGKYTRTAGNVPTDFVELPSQIMENWAGEPEVLKMYAKHYKTGEVIPDKLIEKIEKSSLFNQGFVNAELLAASILDMDYHKLQATSKVNDIREFEKTAMGKIKLIPEIIPRYRSTYFKHIFNGDEYAAGYYVYTWAAVLDADAFDAFKQSGNLFNKDLADKFRKYCLAGGGDNDGMIQYKNFRGQEPSIEPLLKRKGLK